MKPKKRETQKQTARVWLRNHDHRDVIFDLMYHNSIYLFKMKRDSQGQPTSQVETKDYVWLKYPHLYLPFAGMVVGTSHGFIDIERQFIYANPIASGVESDLYVLNDEYVLATNPGARDYEEGSSTYYSSGLHMYIGRITKDGLTWKATPALTPGDIKYGWVPGIFKMGTNCFACFRRDHNGASPYLKLKVQQVIVNDDLTWNVSIPVLITVAYSQSDILDIKTENFYNYEEGTGTQVHTEKHIDYIYMGATSTGTVIKREYNIWVQTKGLYYDPEMGRWYYDGTESNQITRQSQYWRYKINGEYSLLDVIDERSPDPEVFNYLSGTVAVGRCRPFQSIIENGTWEQNSIYYKYPAADRCTQGSTIVMAFFSHSLPYVINGECRWNVSFAVLTSTNDGATWTGVTLGTDFENAININTYPDLREQKVRVFFRKGKFYVIAGSSVIQNKRVRMFSSTNGLTWTEVPLPKWLDVPFATDAGIFTYRNDYSDTVRISIWPDATSDQDYDLYDLDWNNLDILFKDGALYPLKDTFYITFYKAPVKLPGGQGQTPGLLLFFDNEYFAENAQSFAMKMVQEFDTNNEQALIALNNATQEIGEKVLETDYCAPPGGFAGQDPDPDLRYVYYVWNATDQNYDIVDRHLSTYAHYTIVVVDDLPAVGAANTIYAVPADVNKNNIYEYYVWTGDDFVQAQNLTAYANYTKVMVQSLPYQGQFNIIYAVPIDNQAFTSNMYIWNPDTQTFEDINYTSYDMTGKKFSTVNVKSLPTTGRVGVIYISEQKYTPQIITHQDSTYNYYQWDPLNGNYKLVAPVTNTSKFDLVEVNELPADPGSDWAKKIFKLPKELDGKDTHDMYSSEEELQDFLTHHVSNNGTFIYQEQMPKIGVPNVYYFVKEPPSQYSGKYTVYLWNVLLKQYEKKGEYEYWLSDDPSDPKTKRIYDIVPGYAIGEE